MRVHGLILSLAMLAAPAVASAQDNAECLGQSWSAYAQAKNLCNIAVDGTHYFHPQLGLAISGGNPVVGSFRPLGGLGHLFIGIRATAFKTATPNLNSNGSSTTVPPGDSIPLGAPTIDAGIGLYRGMSHGLLAVDLLGSVVAIPNNQKDLNVDPSASKMGNFSYKIGYGARIGILRGTFPIPSVTASWMHREIPTVRFGTVDPSGAGNNYSYQIGLTATNMRLMAGWHVLFFDIGGGIGRDKYTGNAEIKFLNPDPLDNTVKTIPIALDVSRSTIFADIGMNLLFLKVGAEIGKQMDNNLNAAALQGIDVRKGKTYASATVRFQF